MLLLTKKLSTYKLGQFSEYLVAIFLICKGYKILHLRYKHPSGEIDIIARRNKTIAFVEVKSRKKLDLRYTLIGNKQISRITKTAMLYLQKNTRYNGCDIRFDLIIVSNLYNIEHIENAW
jgi:putative endonuclease